MTEFSASEKHRAIMRELKMRRGVYPHWVSVGKITPQEAAHQIAIMEAIAEDYEKLAQSERLL
jgi:hypothetical protein